MLKGLIHILFREFSYHPKKCTHGLKKQPNKSPKTTVQAGVLYMKGSIATLKQYFVDRERDFEYLNLFESKFIQSGVQSIVYAKR